MSSVGVTLFRGELWLFSGCGLCCEGYDVLAGIPCRGRAVGAGAVWGLMSVSLVPLVRLCG